MMTGKSVLSGVLAVGVALMMVGLVGYCRARQSERHGAAQQAVADQKELVAEQEQVVRKDTAALTKADSVLTRVLPRPRVRVDTVYVPVKEDVTSGRVTLDSVFRALTAARLTTTATLDTLGNLRESCTAYRDACRQTVRDFAKLGDDYRDLKDKYETLVKTPQPRRRWGIGCTVGPSVVVARDSTSKLHTYGGAGASCGGTFSF